MNDLKKFDIYKQKNIFGKYVILDMVEKAILPFRDNIYSTGKSVKGNPIYSIKFGYGNIKLLYWSQMHGNEPTTTKGVIDFLYFLNSNEILAKEILEKYTLVIIPMLNPDGAALYTRENANNIDLNRDFQDKSQPETNYLLEIYNTFKPDYCFNLHDQRTIFSVGEKGLAATLSFLAPAYNENRDYNEVRLKAVSMINFLNQNLQNYIPNQIAIFDDAFNINCAGDYFTYLNTPTILIEAGFFPNDYDREITREHVFYALIYTILYPYEKSLNNTILTEYMNIPKNFKNYFDIIFKNVTFFANNSFFITNFAVQYKEELIDNTINFIAYIVEIGDLKDKMGHLEYNLENGLITHVNKNYLKIGDIADFKIGELNFKNGILIN